MLPPYGSELIQAPNFRRLAERCVTFDNAYAGSMPCIPARREMHTGRYNFLHRSWGPLEPFDDSTPELLSHAGVHCHLVSDHPHYWEDGGATYHTRFTTWENVRGQEGDPWKGIVGEVTPAANAGFRLRQQDRVNRRFYSTEARHPQTLTFDAGIDFIQTNRDADSWMVQIECFDPHEPFMTYEHYRDLYGARADEGIEWPQYAKVTQDDATVQATRATYAALASMCDHSLGRVLDVMDELNLWDDTLLIVNTDHGFLLGEHGWWAKGMMPWFNELVHIPLFVWDPRLRATTQRCTELVQTIDIAPTLMRWFGLEPTPDMQGLDLAAAMTDGNGRDAALFGMHGGHVNITDGRYVYMRASASPDNAPLEEYTLMPTHMRARFSPAELRTATLSPSFGFTKNLQVLRTDAVASWSNPYRHGTLLYDLDTDPGQCHPIVDDEVELIMLDKLRRLMIQNNAPESQFIRLGIPRDGELGAAQLLVAQQREGAERAAQPLPNLADLPSGRWSITTPIAQLLKHPQAAKVLHHHLPDLGAVEILNASPETSVYGIATHVPIDPDTLHALASDLAALA